MTDEQLKQDYKAFSQCWKLYKKYAPVEKVDDDMWNLFLKEAGELQNELGDSPMTKVLWGTQKAIDELWTNIEKGGQSNG